MNEIIKYNDAIKAIKTAILQGQYEAAKDVNRVQLAVYFSIGKYISEHSRNNVWGSHALEIISEQLRKELPGLRGFSATQMKEMRLFYEGWEMLDCNSSVMTDELQLPENENVDNSSVATDELQLTSHNAIHNSTITIVEKKEIKETIDIYHSFYVSNVSDFPIEDFFRVPFSHHTRILAGTKDLQARYYYIHRTAEENLSVIKLKQLIKEQAFEHRGDMPNNFTHTIDDARWARKSLMMFKDEYLLDFINVEAIGERDNIDVDERVVEKEIVANIKNFIMTFGEDFAFVGNQKLLKIYNVEQFPDLLFFNRELNSLVVVELKMGKFKTSYLGQLFGYLQILDDKMRKPHENPSIGILLCQEADHAYAEYAVSDYSKPMGVATYKTFDDMPENIRKALPDMTKALELINKK
ncbi:MAG: PDDEXK nuclease domain-containing protein [Paludibacteraceae bacterium]|nr:PDDEXK nuclease domain-containing protein [Paludibacteraceae bacterium]